MTTNEPVELPSDDEIRRLYLLSGGDASGTAKSLGVSRETLYRHLRSARRSAPLTMGRGKKADRDAMAAFVRHQLDRVGILTP